MLYLLLVACIVTRLWKDFLENQIPNRIGQERNPIFDFAKELRWKGNVARTSVRSEIVGSANKELKNGCVMRHQSFLGLTLLQVRRLFLLPCVMDWASHEKIMVDD